jgi:polyphosphate kinase
VLCRFDYEGKDTDLVRAPDPRIIGTAVSVLEDGESADRVFPAV